jgi:hypothetical protein
LMPEYAEVRFATLLHLLLLLLPIELTIDGPWLRRQRLFYREICNCARLRRGSRSYAIMQFGFAKNAILKRGHTATTP